MAEITAGGATASGGSISTFETALPTCRLIHPLAETPGHVRERRDDDVPHAVIGEVSLALEAVIEHLGEPAASREGDQAVSNVARRGNTELLPEPAARSPVVRNRHYGRQVPDPILQAP
jgi:hypothetical protein